MARHAKRPGAERLSCWLLAPAVVARFVLPVWGWRPMFWIGGIPALLALYIRTSVPDRRLGNNTRSERAQRPCERRQTVEAFRLPDRADDVHDVSLARHQDLYPDFLGWFTISPPQLREHRYVLQRRRDIGRHSLRTSLAALWPAHHNGGGARGFPGGDSPVGV